MIITLFCGFLLDRLLVFGKVCTDMFGILFETRGFRLFFVFGFYLNFGVVGKVYLICRNLVVGSLAVFDMGGRGEKGVVSFCFDFLYLKICL